MNYTTRVNDRFVDVFSLREPVKRDIHGCARGVLSLSRCDIELILTPEVHQLLIDSLQEMKLRDATLERSDETTDELWGFGK